MVQYAVVQIYVNIRFACDTFYGSKSGYRSKSISDDERPEIVDWLKFPIGELGDLDFGQRYAYLRNVNSFN